MKAILVKFDFYSFSSSKLVTQQSNPFRLLGDLNEERVVSTEEGQQFAEQHNLLFLETSAKTATNVEEAFVKTSKLIYEKYQKGIIHLAGDAATDSSRKSSPFRSLSSPPKVNEDKPCCAS